MTPQEFNNKYNLPLNQQQLQAIEKTNGPTLLLAVPGSGKTTTLVARIGYLIHQCGLNPQNILTMTYTKAATRDMKNRYHSIFGDSPQNQPKFTTINALCAGIIRKYEQKTGGKAFTLIHKDHDLTNILKQIHIELTNEYPTPNLLNDLKTQTTYCKNMMLDDGEIKKIEVEGTDFPQAYQHYQQYKIQNKLMDFDDQLDYALRILRKNNDILQEYQNKYPTINIDEAQDTSKLQHEIIRTLAGPTPNLFMVGDEDQSIYGYRAAYPQALLDFERHYPGALVLKLETNYRSTGLIVQCANQFIKANSKRHDKNMKSANPTQNPILHTQCPGHQEQTNHLANMAQSCTRETAILYRFNDSSIPLIDLLLKKNIPYRCRENDSLFFTHAIVRDILDILRFAYEPHREDLFTSLYYKLGLTINKDMHQKALTAHQETGQPFFTTLENDWTLEAWRREKITDLSAGLIRLGRPGAFNTTEAIEHIQNTLGYGKYLENKNNYKAKLRTLKALAAQNPDPIAFLTRMEDLQTILKEPSGDEQSPFILSTIHGSKGLEYDHVVLIDVLDGFFPSFREDQLTHLKPEEQELLEEERRLFYVAVTRARKELEILTCSKEHSFFLRNFLSIQDHLLNPGKPSPYDQPLQPEGAQKKTAARGSRLTKGTGTRIQAYDPGMLKIHAEKYIEGFLIDHRYLGRGMITAREGKTIQVHLYNGKTAKLDLYDCMQHRLIKPHTRSRF